MATKDPIKGYHSSRYPWEIQNGQSIAAIDKKIIER